MSGGPRAPEPWGFERSAQARRGAESLRTRERAVESIGVLFQHLDASEDDRAALMKNESARNLLVRWCMEFPLNIQWYEERLARDLARHKTMVVLVIVLALVALGGATIAAFWGLGLREDEVRRSAIAEIGVAIVILFGCLQLMAASVDLKARVAALWNASSDLQESLHTFVENWRGKKLTGDDGRPSPEFIGACHLELSAARKIVRAERTSYFSTMRSPTDMLTVAAGALDVLRTRAKEAAAAVDASPVRMREEAAARRIAELIGGVAEAKADVAAAEFELTHAGPEKQAEAEEALLAARAQLVRAQSLLNTVAKAESLNPY